MGDISLCNGKKWEQKGKTTFSPKNLFKLLILTVRSTTVPNMPSTSPFAICGLRVLWRRRSTSQELKIPKIRNSESENISAHAKNNLGALVNRKCEKPAELETANVGR